MNGWMDSRDRPSLPRIAPLLHAAGHDESARSPDEKPGVSTKVRKARKGDAAHTAGLLLLWIDPFILGAGPVAKSPDGPNMLNPVGDCY